MKAFYALILFILGGASAYGQVGIGTTAPNANAVLELKSPGNNQGFLTPRLTTAQRTALALSATENGLLVFDSDENRFYYWHTSQWLPVRSGNDVALQAGAGISIAGNTISAIADGDGNATNEIQNLQLIGNTLTITNNASATPIDLAPFAGVNTDNQTLSFNAATGALGISGGNTVTVTPTGNNIVSAVNNVSTTNTLNTNRLDGTVVLESESPAGGAISGTFAGGLQINDNAVTTAKILNGAVTPAKISPSGVAGQVLTTVAGATVWANLPAVTGGTVTSITAGTGLSGGTITTTGTISVANNGITATQLQGDASADGNRAVTTNHIRNASVTDAKLSTVLVNPGSFGSSTQIPTFTVNAQGRITSAGSVAVGGSSPEGLAETLATSPDAKGEVAYNLKSLSIGTGQGPGALNVNGSHFASFTMFGDGYNVGPDDYILINNAGTSKPSNLFLPDATKNRGRILIIRSTAQSLGEAVTVRSTEGIDGSAASEPLYINDNFSDNTAYAITVMSTGATWITISRSIGKSKG